MGRYCRECKANLPRGHEDDYCDNCRPDTDGNVWTRLGRRGQENGTRGHHASERVPRRDNTTDVLLCSGCGDPIMGLRYVTSSSGKAYHVRCAP
jgi:hypothetical protein